LTFSFLSSSSRHILLGPSITIWHKFRTVSFSHLCNLNDILHYIAIAMICWHYWEIGAGPPMWMPGTLMRNTLLGNPHWLAPTEWGT
jgi:hypothetical protein